MTVRDLIAKLSKHDPNADVIGYCKCCNDDFFVHSAEEDSVINSGFDDGFHREHCLSKFFIHNVSVCDKKPVGETVVVIH